jgi:hypothetical protein
VRSSIFDAFEREIATQMGRLDYRPSDGQYVSGAASVCARDLALLRPSLSASGTVAGPMAASWRQASEDYTPLSFLRTTWS